MENRPKRRRYKDNPYNLEINNSKYIINFYDSKKVLQKIEVSEEVFSVFDKSELKDLSQMNEYDNHIEHAALFEEVLNKRAINKTKLTEEIAESNIITEELLNAIKELQTTQKRRLILYYLYDYTLEEIAIKEHCSKVAIKYSLDIAIKNLKKNLKNDLFYAYEYTVAFKLLFRKYMKGSLTPFHPPFRKGCSLKIIYSHIKYFLIIIRKR